MQKATIELRCSNFRQRKGAERVQCRRYLGTFSPYEVFVICPNCGQRYRITAGFMGTLDVHRIPEERPLISPNPEAACEACPETTGATP